uniref:Uncharacterized protein n=1 Tax=Strombidium rassoulzadegani TaxID=1082188 RepID=A0A7S3CP50_9SPIT|mmetsp:Transcript_16448/g.27910  ORF Transcript_16448/g.27910 Transcript_16448/m.27910 type:complete len:444 (+) Transcript_16448:173-1504(+)
MVNKRMKLVQCFRKPEVDYKDPSSEGKDALFYNTFRNGFLSAVAMSYNFHLPLILSPADVWLVVLQGFRMHLDKNPDKEFVKLAFQKLDKLGGHVKQKMKVKDEKLHPYVHKIEHSKFEALLQGLLDKTAKKLWNEKHAGTDFSPGSDFASAPKQLPEVQSPSEVFEFNMTSEYEVRLDKEKGLRKAAADQGLDFEETEGDKEEMQRLEGESRRQKALHRMVFQATALQTARMPLEQSTQQQNCSIPKVRFLGTLLDWKTLKRKITYLDRFGCHRWLDALLPVINKFIAAIEKDEVDKGFWENIYSVVPTKTATSDNKVHGWVCNFFPFSGLEETDNFHSKSIMKKMFRERGSEVKKNMFDEGDFPRGLSSLPLKVNDSEFLLFSGFLGVEFHNEVVDPNYPEEPLQYVKPAVGWALYEEDASIKSNLPKVSIAADTAGALFK